MEHEGERTPRVRPVLDDKEVDHVHTQDDERRPIPTDSMITVTLSERSFHTHQDSAGMASGGKHSRSGSFESFDAGTEIDEDGSDWDEDDVVVEEATAAIAARPMNVRRTTEDSSASSPVEVADGQPPQEDDTQKMQPLATLDTDWPTIQVDRDLSPVNHLHERIALAKTVAPIEEEPSDGEAEKRHSLSMTKPDITVDTEMARSRPNSFEIMQGASMPPRARGSMDFHAQGIDRMSTFALEETLHKIEEGEESDGEEQEQRGRSRSNGSDGSTRVDWEELDRTEEREVKDADETGDEVRSNFRLIHICCIQSSPSYQANRPPPRPPRARKPSHSHRPESRHQVPHPQTDSRPPTLHGGRQIPCQEPPQLRPRLAHALPAAHDRARLLGRPRQGLPCHRAASAHSHLQQDPRRHPAAVTRCSLGQHGRREGHAARGAV